MGTKAYDIDGPKIAHNVGRRRVVDRQQPRKSKRTTPRHADKYADQRVEPDERLLIEKLAELIAMYSKGGEVHHG